MSIKVLKKNLAGEVTWQYEGNVLRREPNAVVLEALFNRPDTPFMDVVLKENDRFVETFYSDRWYNIFKIYDRDDGKVKGWYCNIGMPAVVEDEIVSYVDLALDLWVSVDGKQTVLDEDEFEALKLNDELRTGALAGLDELKQLFESKNLRNDSGGSCPCIIPRSYSKRTSQRLRQRDSNSRALQRR